MKPRNLKTKHWLAYNTLFFIEHFLGPKYYNTLFKNIETKLYKNIDEDLSKKNNEEEVKAIEINPGEYTEPFKDPYLPIVFRNAAKDWNAVKNWNFDFFSENYGDVDVILINNQGLISDSQQNNNTVSLKDYIVGLKQGRKEYLKFSRVIEDKSELIADININWLRKFRTKSARNDLFYVFMGGKDTFTPLHTAFAHTVFIQIEGSKKWTFYRTSDRLFIGARPKRFNYFYSDMDLKDLKNNILLKYAKPFEVTINEGDILFFPSFIWHQVENTSDSIGVAYKFAEFKGGLTASKMLTTCILLSTKPPLFYSLFPTIFGDTYNYKKKESLTKKIIKQE